jgi:hypothetical protein
MDGWRSDSQQDEEPKVYGTNDIDFSGGYLQLGLRVYIF